jgi:uncharacterized protein with von Willebrand factor type A (vWA) domain
MTSAVHIGTGPSPLDTRVIALARSLRTRGFGVSVAETLDAISVLRHIELTQRSELRECLRSALVKSSDDRGAFDNCFDRHFPRTVRDDPNRASVDIDDNALVDGLVGGGDLSDMAAALVEEHGGFDGDLRGEKHHVHRVMRAADLARLMMLALRTDDVDATEIRSRLEELRQMISEDVRGRLGADDEIVEDSTAESIEFLKASRADLDRMRSAIQPLARQIATKLARRRQQAQSGRLAMQQTVRKSLSTGGVPFDLATKRPKPHHPELYVLCDISGSVAEFSLFTLTLMSALSSELTRTRSFVFVDDVDEITELLMSTGHAIEPWQIMRNTNAIGPTGHSDYGRVFQEFWTSTGETELTTRSTVIITGDGRSNYQPAEAEALKNIAQRCRSVFWLNPEVRSEWGAFDSDVDTYAPHCTKQFEVRDLHQLAQCVQHII